LGLVAALLGFAAPARADRLDELQGRFEGRFGELRRYKDQGKVGETTTGLVEAVAAADDALRGLIAAENADRQELYALIAEKEKTTAAKVAERNAARNFQKAKSGDYLKGRDGQWKRKA
jgi:uncharacterized protein YdbL (DUF1318 family)